MRARIYQTPKNAMQSGAARTADWVLEYAPNAPQRADRLMGWIGSTDTQRQVVLRFESREEAIGYAERNGIDFDLELPRPKKFRPKNYSDNFRFGRTENWTH